MKMTRNGKIARPIVRNAAYRQAFQRLDESLEENTTCDNREKIRLMRQAMFADVDELQKSGRIKLPKP
jgi:hypothetical protein